VEDGEEPLDLENLRRALGALERSLLALEQTEQEPFAALREAVQSGVIQNFEVAYEVAWKTLRRRLIAIYGAANVEPLSRHGFFRLAARGSFIGDVDCWMEFHRQRNGTAHRYGEELLGTALEVAGKFAAAGRELLGTLESWPSI
jgi:nucleotidyltransferase substrate binding protein (TIGR01987 family)